MGKIKVLHIITRLDRGGSSENTLLTCLGLDEQRYEVTLMAGETKNPLLSLIGEAKRTGVRFVFIPNLVRDIHPLKDILALIKITKVLRKEAFDIVHTHSSKAGLLGRLAAKLAAVPIIIYAPHGHIFYGYFNPLLTKIFVAIEKLAARFTDKIITLSEKGKKEQIKFKIAPDEKFVGIHSGVRFDNFSSVSRDRKAKRKELTLPADSLLIGTVGRLVPIKGQRYLIEAMAYLKDAIPNLILLFVGNGPLQQDLEMQAQDLKISDQVRFLGLREDVPEILSILDLFVLPSINEGMGRALLEAMALAIPVVATDVGGTSDLVIDGKTGLLVRPQDPRALASAMLNLLNNKTLAKQLAEQGKRWVVPKFSSEEMVRKTDDLYQELLR